MKRNPVPPAGGTSVDGRRSRIALMSSLPKARPAGRPVRPKGVVLLAVREAHVREKLRLVKIELLADRRPTRPMRMRGLIRAFVKVPAPAALSRLFQRA